MLKWRLIVLPLLTLSGCVLAIFSGLFPSAFMSYLLLTTTPHKDLT